MVFSRNQTFATLIYRSIGALANGKKDRSALIAGITVTVLSVLAITTVKLVTAVTVACDSDNKCDSTGSSEARVHKALRTY